MDVLVAGLSQAALAAKKATSTIPIVMTGADLVGLGLVASLARPGGNFTGVTDSHADLVAKRLELLKEIAPSARQVAILFNPASPIVPPQLKAAQAAANPGDLPVEQPTKFVLVVNMKTLKALGLSIPQSVLVRADEIIQ